MADKPEDGLLYIAFKLTIEGGTLRRPDNEFELNPISDVRFVPVMELPDYGFSERWRDRGRLLCRCPKVRGA